MNSPKSKESYREQLADLFINILEEKSLDWKKEWQGASNGSYPCNIISKQNYQGVNIFNLMMESLSKGYNDNRWVTMNQIMDKNEKYHKGEKWHLKKGSKATYVEYWTPYDLEEKKIISWSELDKMKDEGLPQDHVTFIAKYTPVFNASCVEGIPPLEIKKIENQNLDEMVSNISKNMNVKILNDGGNNAYYNKNTDTIHLPTKESFFSEYAYNSTALHELAHSTGHETRLNRDLSGMFGSENYAYEELVAEISSCFTSINMPFEQDEAHLENHKAYVQSWVKLIKDKPSLLIDAVKDAQICTNYLENNAQLKIEQSLDNSVDLIDEKMGITSISILQIKKGDEYRYKRFEGLDRWSETPNTNDYNLIYIDKSSKFSDVSDNEIVEETFAKYNINRPDDFMGHSLSVSDIVILQRVDSYSAYFIDSEGLSLINDFVDENLKVKIKDNITHKENKFSLDGLAKKQVEVETQRSVTSLDNKILKRDNLEI